MNAPLLLTLALTLAGCKGSDDDSGEPWVPPGCGDGVLDADEACDEGAENSDTAADACRADCLPARCGDEVVDAGETCDDGGLWGGDGCSVECAVEEGQLEVEPNDAWDSAEPWSGEPVFGKLTEGDRDCFAVELEECGAIEARLVGACPEALTLALHSPEGDQVAVGVPGFDGACPSLDPSRAEGARFVQDGTWAVCVEAVQSALVVPGYALEITPLTDAAFPLGDGDDPDGDGLPASCDDDDDGDGVDDEDDNCPEVANGPDAGLPTTNSSGFIVDWLAAGPYTGRSSAESCLPTPDDLVADADADALPALAEPAGEALWIRLLADGDGRVELLDDFGGVGAPREAYLAVYVRDPQARTLTLGLGPDDGARAWLDDAVLIEVSGCQGTNVDQFTAEAQLSGGWQRLMLKVYDQGGGWGTYARFLDSAGEPVTDLELSLEPDGAARDSQVDSDGDGLGDDCDPTPGG